MKQACHAGLFYGAIVLVDSHCHLDRLDLAPYQGSLSAALDAARQRGVQRFLCIGIGRQHADQLLAMTEAFPDVFLTLGLHPLEFVRSDYNPEPEQMNGDAIEQWLASVADQARVVGIGETGLDYYYSMDDGGQERQHQQDSFARHLQIAARLEKPVVVHTRDAREDTIRLIREHGSSRSSGVLHCFTESWEMAKQALDLGYYISFSGIISFKNADKLRQVAAKIPKDRILVETDSPYLAPVPYRGKKNEPGYVVEVANCLADIRGVAVETLIEQTGENFCRLFGVQ